MAHTLYFFKKEFILGGSVSIPLDKSENDKIQEIGDNFYQTCEANEQSGKTLWIGIERSIGDYWVVIINIIIDMYKYNYV